MVRLLCQDIVVTCFFLTAVGALEGVEDANFGDAAKNVQKSELAVSYKTQK